MRKIMYWITNDNITRDQQNSAKYNIANNVTNMISLSIIK